MKRFSRCVCFFIVASLLLATPGFAAETSTTRASNFFGSSSVYLYKTTGTTFQAWFDVSALRIMDELGASEIKIQRSSDGASWTTMRTYTKDVYSQLICEDTSTHAACVTYTGTAGYYYRAKITLYAKDSSGMGEVTEYTSTIRL